MKLLSQFSKREKFLFFFTLVVVISAVLLNLLILPLNKKWNRLEAQLLNLKTKLTRYQRLITLEKEIDAKYRLYADYLKLRGSKEEALASVLQEFEKLARLSKVVLTNIVPSPLEEKGFYNKFEVRMEMESDISSLVQFLYELQKSKYLFRVLRLSITTKGSSGETLRNSLQVMKIFVP